MAKEILDAEQLDSMWPKDATGEPDYADNMMSIQDSLRELRNQRSRSKTLEDAIDAYDGLVARAHKTRALGVDGQTSTLQAIGRAGTGNSQWNYPGDFSWAVWLIADHEGEQIQRNSVLDAESGMSLEDYKPLVKAHSATLAVLRKEQADMKLQAQMEQAQRSYENELESIEGDD